MDGEILTRSSLGSSADFSNPNLLQAPSYSMSGSRREHIFENPIGRRLLAYVAGAFCCCFCSRSMPPSPYAAYRVQLFPCLVCEFSLQLRMNLVSCFWAAALTGTVMFYHLSEFVRGTLGRIMPSLLLFSSASALIQSATRSNYLQMSYAFNCKASGCSHTLDG